MDNFVEAYDTRTGKKQRVPRDWVGEPNVGRFLKLTPSQRELDGAAAAALVEAEEAAADQVEDPANEAVDEVVPDQPVRPTEDDTAKAIEAYADAADIDLTGHKGSKAAMVARINEVLDTPVETAPDPDGIQPTDETPATGDEEN